MGEKGEYEIKGKEEEQGYEEMGAWRQNYDRLIDVSENEEKISNTMKR